MSRQKKFSWVLVLLGFGVLISGPRFSGAFAAALGIDLIQVNPVWGYIEIGSGWALALFEAMAIAYIASRFKSIQILSHDESLPLRNRILPANMIYWIIVLLGQVFLLLTIPAVATVHLATQVFRDSDGAVRIPEILTWRHIYMNHLTWAWLFITSAASTLFVFLIGIVMEDFGVLKKSSQNNDQKLFDSFNDLRKKLPVVDPHSLARHASVPVSDAIEFLDSINPAVAIPIQKRLDDLKRKEQNGVGYK